MAGLAHGAITDKSTVEPGDKLYSTDGSDGLWRDVDWADVPRIAQARGLVVENDALPNPLFRVVVTADEMLLSDGQYLSSVSLTISIAAGNAKNALGTGLSESSDTWYYIFVGHDAGTAYGWLDTSPTGANDPDSTNTGRMYVGAIYNDSGSDFIDLHQIGNRVHAESNSMLSGGTATSYTLTNAARAPSHIRELFVEVSVAETSGTAMDVALSVDGQDELRQAKLTVPTGSSAVYVPMHIPCTTAQKIYYDLVSGDTVDINCIGWVDHKVNA